MEYVALLRQATESPSSYVRRLIATTEIGDDADERQSRKSQREALAERCPALTLVARHVLYWQACARTMTICEIHGAAIWHRLGKRIRVSEEPFWLPGDDTGTHVVRAYDRLQTEWLVDAMPSAHVYGCCWRDSIGHTSCQHWLKKTRGLRARLPMHHHFL